MKIKLTTDLLTAQSIIGIFIVGTIMGFFLFPKIWPIRTYENIAYPINLGGLLLFGTGVIFFLFLSVLRYLEGNVLPFATGIAWMVFALGSTLGLYIRERRRQ